MDDKTKRNLKTIKQTYQLVELFNTLEQLNRAKVRETIDNIKETAGLVVGLAIAIPLAVGVTWLISFPIAYLLRLVADVLRLVGLRS